MPARKPQGLHTRHATKAEKAERNANEESLRPEKGLPMSAPARLDGHDAASALWRRLMRTWEELDATVVTRLDMDLLIDYCVLSEQVQELDRMRKASYDIWLQLGQRHDEAEKKARAAKKAAREQAQAAKDAGFDLPADAAKEAERLSDEAVSLAAKCVDAFEAVVKLDGRADRKRALLLQWRQALYLTPRARAGAAPAKKEKPAESIDPMDALLNAVNDYVNSDGEA